MEERKKGGETNMNLATSPAPTFYLRRVDVNKVLENYGTGRFCTTNLPREKLNLQVTPVALQAPIGTSPNDPIYSFRLRNNIQNVIATSNAKRYALFTSEGEKMALGGQCDYCGCEFQTEALGIPIAMTEYAPQDDENKPVHFYGNKDEAITAYYCEGTYCSFECLYAGYKRYYGNYSRYRDDLYMDSGSMILHLYNKAHPGAGPLGEAKDSRLHKRKNGSLEDTEFHNKKHTYMRMPSVILAPAKVQYQRVET